MRNRQRAGGGAQEQDLTPKVASASVAVIAAVLALLVAGCDPEAPSPEGQLLDVLDSDHDGWLSRAEFEHCAYPGTRFVDFDEDGDDRVDHRELRALLETVSPVLPR